MQYALMLYCGLGGEENRGEAKFLFFKLAPQSSEASKGGKYDAFLNRLRNAIENNQDLNPIIVSYGEKRDQINNEVQSSGSLRTLEGVSNLTQGPQMQVQASENHISNDPLVVGITSKDTLKMKTDVPPVFPAALGNSNTHTPIVSLVGHQPVIPSTSFMPPFQKRKMDQDCYNSFLSHMTSEKLEAAAEKLREKSFDGSNGVHFAKEMIEYLLQVNTHDQPALKKRRVDSLCSAMTHWWSFLDPYLPMEEKTVTVIDDKEGFKDIIDFGIKHSVKSSDLFELIDNLKTLASAEDNPYRVSSGVVNLLGYMIVYFARPNEVLFIDCQTLSRGERHSVFSNFSEAFPHLNANNFQKKVAYIPISLSAPVTEKVLF